MMTFDMLVFTPWIALIAGVSILVVPRLLNYIVAIYHDFDLTRGYSLPA
jgi:hypothetical protein